MRIAVITLSLFNTLMLILFSIAAPVAIMSGTMTLGGSYPDSYHFFLNTYIYGVLLYPLLYIGATIMTISRLRNNRDKTAFYSQLFLDGYILFVTISFIITMKNFSE